MGAAVLVLVVMGVLAVSGLAVWWRRRRSPRQLYSADYEQAKGQAYLQAQHTRNNLNGPFQGGP